jgi:hypothetical protein
MEPTRPEACAANEPRKRPHPQSSERRPEATTRGVSAPPGSWRAAESAHLRVRDSAHPCLRRYCRNACPRADAPSHHRVGDGVNHFSIKINVENRCMKVLAPDCGHCICHASSSTSSSRFPATTFRSAAPSSSSVVQRPRDTLSGCFSPRGYRHGEAQSSWAVKCRATVQQARDTRIDDSSAIALGMRRLDRSATGLDPLQLQLARAQAAAA